MKKTMLGFAACALILSSCSQNEELVDNSKLNQEEIKFTPYVNKTKASVTNLDAMEVEAYPGFKVFAVQHATGIQTDYSKFPKFMDNLNVKYSGSSWTHSGKYYWPETDALSFFAIAPDNKDKVGKFNQGSSITVPITIQDDVANQIDILAASALNLTRTENTVDFQFKHILSRIGFKAKVQAEDNLKFKINSVSYIYGEKISKQGVLSFVVPVSNNEDKVITIANSEVYHENNSSTPYPMTLPAISLNNGREHIIEGITAKPIHGLSSYLMILPQDLSGKTFVTLIIKYQIAVAGDVWGKVREVSVTIPGMNYVMGSAYTHNLIFSGDTTGNDDLLEVKFGVTDVQSWGLEVPDQGTEVPNSKPSSEQN